MNDARPILWQGLSAGDYQRFVERSLEDPHRVLGAHRVDDGVVLRAWRPGASEARVFIDGEPEPRRMQPMTDEGLFGLLVQRRRRAPWVARRGPRALGRRVVGA
ncbi:MAG: hypothetical protein R3A52_11630 [Polyangiales bacterium]